MERFKIVGPTRLQGEVQVSGSKNSAASILPAALLTSEDCIIHNVPKISDTLNLLDIISSLGALVEWIDDSTVKINAADIDPTHLNLDVMKQIRMSILIVGPLLSRFGKITFVQPGGCKIGARPIDTHLSAFESIGATVEIDGESIHITAKNGLVGSNVVLKEISVTATENLVLAGALVEEEIDIYLAACEPHVEDICLVLKEMGVELTGEGTHHIWMKGKRELSGFEWTLSPDPIEVGTFLIAGAVSGGDVLVKGAREDHLRLEVDILRRVGAEVTIENEGIRVVSNGKLKSIKKIQSLPYPGFSSDMLSLFALLMTQSEGVCLIHESLYEGRLENYIPTFGRMGAQVVSCDPHRAIVTGPSKLEGKSMISFDLRAGAALILAGIIAEGVSYIDNIGQVDRGYERIDEKLRMLGANIERVSGGSEK